MTRFAQVCFGSLAELHDTPKAAAQVAAKGGEADVAIGISGPGGTDFDVISAARSNIASCCLTSDLHSGSPVADPRLGEFQQQDEDAERERRKQHGKQQHYAGMPYAQ